MEMDRIVLGTGMYYEDRAVDHIEMWYDRSRRNWVLYPVDAEGNQLAEASYGFGKKDALQTKAMLEEEWLR